MMTIDERLEKLTERHEALAQSVELLVAQGHETDRRLNVVTEDIARLTADTSNLLTIVTIQNERLKRLEDQAN
jgi:hypothetical protein